MPRTYRLRLSLDSKYLDVVQEARSLLERCLPARSVGRLAADAGATAVLYVYDNHLPCLFPQHGAGRKHERCVRLEPWQQALVDEAPWSLLRGLIVSDGCVYVNRTGRYEYLSYDFMNLSPDILDLFLDTCRSVGVEARRYAKHARIYRRASVALMQANVGVKS